MNSTSSTSHAKQQPSHAATLMQRYGATDVVTPQIMIAGGQSHSSTDLNHTSNNAAAVAAVAAVAAASVVNYGYEFDSAF